MKSFYSNVKVLLTGEYSVLNGSSAIGLPTKMGQDMLVEDDIGQTISWSSFNMNSQKWFECLLEEIPTEWHDRLGGIAVGAAGLGTGPLEDVKRALAFRTFWIILHIITCLAIIAGNGRVLGFW